MTPRADVLTAFESAIGNNDLDHLHLHMPTFLHT